MTSSSTAPALDAARVQRAKVAVGWVFAVNGFAIANWLARLPTIKDNLDLTPSRLALALIAGSAGSVLALPLSGPVVHRLKPAASVRAFAVLCLLGIGVVGVAGSGAFGGVPLLAVGLFCFGVGNAVWDVSMNVEAAAVERLVGRAIMPRFHAAFSLGTVAGAGAGALGAAVDLSVAVQYAVVAVVVLVAVVRLVLAFLPVEAVAEEEHQEKQGSGALAAWKERRTLLVGLLALGMALAEGSANDWVAIGFREGYGVSEALAAVGFAVFVSAMTLGRMVGPGILDRIGRVAALRGGAVFVMVGVLLFIAGASVVERAGMAYGVPLGVLGALAWGVGASLGFPVAMSAAADDPSRAAARVSVVASLGYVAFLAGPPFLGLLGDRLGVVRAMFGVVVAVTLALLCAGAARPISQEP